MHGLRHLYVQDAMADHLQEVGEEVDASRAQIDATREEVGNVHNSVKELEANLDEISFHQQTANEGIKLLCRYASRV